MSNKPISMHKLRQVIRWLLSPAEVLYGQGKGSKSINSMLGVSRNTIKTYLQIFHLSGMSYEHFFSMSDHDLSLLFQVHPSPAASDRQSVTEPAEVWLWKRCFLTFASNLNVKVLRAIICTGNIWNNILTVTERSRSMVTVVLVLIILFIFILVNTSTGSATIRPCDAHRAQSGREDVYGY
jgi:hypothetical protein